MSKQVLFKVLEKAVSKPVPKKKLFKVSALGKQGWKEGVEETEDKVYIRLKKKHTKKTPPYLILFLKKKKMTKCHLQI